MFIPAEDSECDSEQVDMTVVGTRRNRSATFGRDDVTSPDTPRDRDFSFLYGLFQVSLSPAGPLPQHITFITNRRRRRYALQQNLLAKKNTAAVGVHLSCWAIAIPGDWLCQ